MKRKIVLKSDEYERYFFPLKILFKKSESKSFSSIIREELDKIHPSFDQNCEVFSKIILQDKKLLLWVVVVHKSIFIKYNFNRVRKILVDNRTIRLRPKKNYFLFLLLSLIVIIGIFAFASKNLKSKNNMQSEQEAIQNTFYIENDFKTKTITFDMVMNSLSLFSESTNPHFSLLNIRTDNSDTHLNTILTLEIEKTFPEQLALFLKEDISFENTKVLYVNNSPTYTADLKFFTELSVSTPQESIINLRNLIMKSGGNLLYEDALSNEVKASISIVAILKLFTLLSTETEPLVFDSFEIHNLKQGEVELYCKIAKEGFALFSHEEFVHFLDSYFFKSFFSNMKPAVPVVTEQKKEKIKENNDAVFGKITQIDGSTMIFYKSTEGKIESEVSP